MEEIATVVLVCFLVLFVILGVKAITNNEVDTHFIERVEVVNNDQLYIYTTDGTRLGVELVDEQDTYEIVYKDQSYAIVFLNSCVAGVPDRYVAQQCTHYVLFDGRNYIAPDVDL